MDRGKPYHTPSDQALSFLSRELSPAGHWEDFTSRAFGSSTLWVTGYTGWCLSSADAGAPALRQARSHLIANRHDDGWGWGYTRVGFPSDADSTALCTLFLAEHDALGRDDAVQIAAFLLSHQRPDGGFTTFSRPELLQLLPYFADVPSVAGWCASHPSVTAAVVQALLALGLRAGTPAIHDALAFLEARQDADGLWYDYWWLGPYYATFQVLRAARRLEPEGALAAPFRRAARSLLAAQRPEGFWTNAAGGQPCAFSTALALHALLLANPDERDSSAMEAGLGWLQSAQYEDGSWAAPEILRIPWPADVQPSAARAKLKAPVRRIFSTATVFAALQAVGLEHGMRQRELGACDA